MEVAMPQMGESIFEGTITKWLKKPGDKVQRDEPLFEISTDKVDAEIPSPTAGILKEVKVDEGQTVPVQTVVAVIEVAGIDAQATPPAPAQAKPKNANDAGPPVHPKPQPAKPAGISAPRIAATPKHPCPPAGSRVAVASTEKIRDSSVVRPMGPEPNIGPSQIPSTDVHLSKKDTARAGETYGTTAPETPSAPIPVPASPPPAKDRVPALEKVIALEKLYFGSYEVQPMSAMRQRIAEHMVLSKRVSPHVYSVDEVDVTAIATLRAKTKEKFEQTAGTKLTFMPFFVRAAVEGLRAYPIVNASVDGTNVVLHKECNIGIAVALEWGLIVPVVKNAEEKNLLGIARAINDLAERARAKKLKAEEVGESTFSITNPGIFGGLLGLPVINQPNVAILGVGAIEKRPVIIGDAIAIRSMVYLTLSYDHRVVDGATAHQFMSQVKHTLEHWSEAIL